jgi:hypothetical protein
MMYLLIADEVAVAQAYRQDVCLRAREISPDLLCWQGITGGYALAARWLGRGLPVLFGSL